MVLLRARGLPFAIDFNAARREVYALYRVREFGSDTLQHPFAQRQLQRHAGKLRHALPEWVAYMYDDGE